MFQVSIKLYILSFVGPSDLCRCCLVSYEWYRLCNDELLWKHILAERSRNWSQIYDDGNPEFYRRVCPQMPSKQMYVFDNDLIEFIIADIFVVIRIVRSRAIIYRKCQIYSTISYRQNLDSSCSVPVSKQTHHASYDRYSPINS